MVRCVSVGIIENAKKICGILQGEYMLNGKKAVTGPFDAQIFEGKISLEIQGELFISDKDVSFLSKKDSCFFLKNVALGKGFHWESSETQVFFGDLVLKVRNNNNFCVVNRVDIEDYVRSVVASEMSSFAPIEFLKAHAIVARTWVLAKITKKEKGFHPHKQNGEILRIYDESDHDLFDICADDHCQRYHGFTKVLSDQVDKAVRDTDGIVLKYGETFCDARYSKCCGGRTEVYSTAWEDKDLPYLISVSDGQVEFPPIRNEAEMEKWVRSRPPAFCNVQEKKLLSTILNNVDLTTENFFRWQLKLEREEIEDLLKKKAGIDLGEIKKIVPAIRGPSGRIKKLLVEGEKGSVLLGKELEIRRVLSHTHLLSSAFFIEEERDKKNRLKSVKLFGAGWGHGVGMCQIGAAVMAHMGYTCKEILKHYYRGARLENIYEKEI